MEANSVGNGHATPDVSVVVPLHDERETLRALYESVRDVCFGARLSFEIVLVDDGSTDGSIDVLRALGAEDARVRPIALRRNFGKAAALSTGFRAARGRRIVTMDADLQDDPREIVPLLQRLDEGYGVVSGWKQRRRDPWTRRLASRTFNRAVGRVTGVRLHDVNCGLKAYTRECAKDIAGTCYGELHRFLPVLAHSRGFRVTEIPVRHHERRHGRSRYGFERYLRGFLDLFTTVFLSRWFRRPMHVFGSIGLLLFVPGAISLLWLIVHKTIFGASIGQRPLLTLGAVLCIAGLQLMLAGLLAEMIAGPRAVDVPNVEIVRHSAYATPRTIVLEPGGRRVNGGDRRVNGGDRRVNGGDRRRVGRAP